MAASFLYPQAIHRTRLPISMREVSVVIVLAVVISACGGDSEPGGIAPTPTTSSIPSSPLAESSSVPAEVSAVTTLPDGPGTTLASASGPTPTTAAVPGPGTTPETRPRPDGEDAPDFTIALGQGGSFTLSEAQKPVYMVFWAEW